MRPIKIATTLKSRLYIVLTLKVDAPEVQFVLSVNATLGFMFIIIWFNWLKEIRFYFFQTKLIEEKGITFTPKLKES